MFNRTWLNKVTGQYVSEPSDPNDPMWMEFIPQDDISRGLFASLKALGKTSKQAAFEVLLAFQ